MPGLLDSGDPFTAALSAARAGYRSKARPQLMEREPLVQPDDPTEELVPKNQGAFLSALQWIGRPGQVIKNVLTGNLEGAARQAGDFLGDAADAILPGDLIPQLSRRQDEVSGLDVLGTSKEWQKEHPLLSTLGSLPIDILTDPLTYTGFGPIAKGIGIAGKGAAQAASKLPRGAAAVQAIKDTAEVAGRGFRSVIGSQRLLPEVEGAAQAAMAAKGNIARAGASEAERLFAGMTPKELEVAGDVADNLLHDAAGRPVGLLTSDPASTIAQRIAAHPEAAGMDPVRLERAITESKAFMARQGVEGGLGPATPGIGQMLSGAPASGAPNLPIFTSGPGIEDYLPRLYKGQTEADALDELIGRGSAVAGAPKPIAERTLLTPSAQIEHFAKNPQLTNVRNLAERVVNRVSQQAEMGKRATLGAQILEAVRAGRIQIPESELQKLLAGAPDKAVRLGENTAADIAPRAASPGDTLFSAGLGRQTGSSPALVGNQAADLLGSTGADLNKVYGVGEFSGTAKAPGSSGIVDLLREPREIPDIYGIGSQSGRARPPGAIPDLGAPTGLGGALPSGVSRPPSTAASGLDLLGGLRKEPSDIYGLGSTSGVSKPPGTAASGLDLLSGMSGEAADIYGIGSRSGTSVAPGQAASGLDLLAGAGPKIGQDIYGVGSQSGKAVAAGERQAVRPALDPMASLAGQSKPISDLTRAVDRVMTHEFRLADPQSRAIVNAAIKGMDPESARYAADLFNGLAPRGPILDALAKVNRVVKPMMVYGFAIPKFGAIVRNKISGIWQAGSNPASRAVALKQAQRLPSDLYGAVVDSLGLKIPKDALGQAGNLIEDAFKQSGGLADNAAQFLEQSAGAGGYTGQELASVVRSGAMSGFVSSEDLIKSMAASPKAKTWKSVTEWPARMFKGVEDRMRAGMALDLLRKGKSPDEIGKIVSDSLYDYSITSAGNRAARDVLPFAQYSMKAGVQQAKLLNEKPWLAVGLSSLLTEKEGQTTYPYMDGRLNIPLGADDKGNQTYASGLGLPFEALNMIPNPSGSLADLGRDVGRTLVGSSQPLLKTAGALAFGNDPMFGTPVGSYSKLPGNIEGGALGRVYNLAAGAGLTQPAESALRLAGKLADDRGSAGSKALDLLTGTTVVNVDPDRALQQRLTNYLRSRPDIASITSLYSKTHDPEGLALIKALNEAKKRSKAKRQAEAP